MSDDTLDDPRKALANLQRELAARTAERDEALAQQAAVAEVLGVINASPGDLGPVFDAMLEKALNLCGAAFGILLTYDGDHFRHGALHSIPAAYAEFMREHPPIYGPGTAPGRLAFGERLVHVLDMMDTEAYRSGDPNRRAIADLAGARTLVAVPLRKDNALLGAIVVFRREVRPFSDKQIALLQNFAAQAVIAMENARLLTETREALEQQTATAEVLQVINSSPGDLAPVFDAMLEKATRLSEGTFGILWIFEGEFTRAGALHNVPETYAELIRTPFRPSAESGPARLMRGEGTIAIPDLMELPGYSSGDFLVRAIVHLGGARSVIIVPMHKDGGTLGAITTYRTEVRPFTGKQIALLENFAAQAVIAIENARLITETREALEQQTATTEVLQVINASPGDLAPVFDAMLEKATTLCDAAYGTLFTYDGDCFNAVALRGVPAAFAEALGAPVRADPGAALYRIERGERFAHFADVANEAAYRAPAGRVLVELGGARSALAVPLRKDDALLGAFAIYRQEVRPFSDKQVALLQNFAAQAVIAMENARLITETRQARDEAETALRDLKAAQASLIHAEKMASLGQLTAGIAHEIKNPLNFVNNFAGLSVELLEELKETAAPGVATLDDGTRAQIDETVEMLTSNLDKIAEHGKRADGIVKSMLEHSRGVTGERRKVDLNALVEEALNLAYHGARAHDQSFNITMERDLDARLAPIALAPQEITRVFLNLFGNGFYAATKRARETADGFRPVLTIRTRDLGEAVEVRVRDNGSGIPPEIKDKLFQPFFTTKPTGEGTGLGLSISYDIVTQEHGGTITVESEPGAFTEFTIRLPRH